VEASYEFGTETLTFINGGEFLDYRIDYRHLRKDFPQKNQPVKPVELRRCLVGLLDTRT